MLRSIAAAKPVTTAATAKAVAEPSVCQSPPKITAPGRISNPLVR